MDLMKAAALALVPSMLGGVIAWGSLSNQVAELEVRSDKIEVVGDRYRATEVDVNHIKDKMSENMIRYHITIQGLEEEHRDLGERISRFKTLQTVVQGDIIRLEARHVGE